MLANITENEQKSGANKNLRFWYIEFILVLRLFYLALPPNQFLPVATCIKQVLVNDVDISNVRVVIEKPFGRDLDSSNELSLQISKLFNEEQVFEKN